MLRGDMQKLFSFLILGLFLNLGYSLYAKGANADVSTSEALAQAKFSDPRKNFEKVISLIKEKYFDESVTDEELYYHATNGVLSWLNQKAGPKSSENKLLSPKEFDIWRQDEKIVGIGIVLKFNEKAGNAEIERIHPDGAAEKAGLMRGDFLISVDGQMFKNLDEMIEKIRGPEGKPVRIRFRRGDQEMEKTIVRQKLVVIDFSIRSYIFSGKIGFIQIEEFTNLSISKIRETFSRFKKKQIKGLIVDLRECKGGEVDPIIKSLSYLVPSGIVVGRATHREQKTREFISEYETENLMGIPLVVLTDKRTH